MNALFPLILLAAAAPVDQPRMFLVSIAGVALKPGESIKGFSIPTWGVTVNAVCHIPGGWTIRAGRNANPEGILEGKGSNGVTWINAENVGNLRDLFLVTLYQPVQRRDLRPTQGALIPATFKGYATVWGDDDERKVSLSYANIRLTVASRCPAPRT